MTLDLDRLAARLAEQLAAADRTRRSAAEGPRPTPPAPAPASNGGAPPGVKYVRDGARIADFIDHTLLKAETTAADIDKLCAEAAEHRFAAVCVNPAWVPRCVAALRGAPVRIATVIGFPLGANRSETKAAEAARAVADGATELDMVAAIGSVKSGDWQAVRDDIAAVVGAASGRLVKVIVESAVLTPVEIIKTSALARDAGAQYVKTSTGFHPAGGASAEAIALMRLVVGDALGVKASGGVRDCAAALTMIAAGATRIGTSSGVAMAKCLGAGPMPIRDLLTSPHVHAEQCATGSCAPEPDGASAY